MSMCSSRQLSVESGNSELACSDVSPENKKTSININVFIVKNLTAKLQKIILQYPDCKNHKIIIENIQKALC